MDELLEFILKVKSDSKLKFLDEASTKQAIILKILPNLGWDIFNVEEVVPEYSVGKRKVDYSLRDGNLNKVFIEVKKVGEDLENHQNQLLDYSFRQGVKLAVLTNGISWWLYLPLNEGSWEQRKFFTVEIPDQDAEKIVSSFNKFLSKENVLSGKAVEEAEKIHKSAIKDTLVKETLPEAWDKLIKEPDENLVELLADTTEKLCGYKPDNIDVAEFLGSYTPGDTIKISEKVKKTDKGKKSKYVRTGYTGKKIISFTLNGKQYQGDYWINFLIKIAELMLELNKDNFNQVLSLKGRKRPYFTKNPNELRIPYQIKGTDIHMEANLDANSTVSIAKDLITLFGFKKDDLKIEAVDK